MLELKRSAFHARTSSLCLAQNWRRWAGHIVAGSYDLVLDREYWAIRNAAALIDISPLMKYRISGKDAARLLHRVTPRNIHKMAVGQVAYTGWCDEHGKLIDDGTIARLAEDTFRLTAAEPSLRWLAMNAVGMGVEINDESDRLEIARCPQRLRRGTARHAEVFSPDAQPHRRRAGHDLAYRLYR